MAVHPRRLFSSARSRWRLSNFYRPCSMSIYTVLQTIPDSFASSPLFGVNGRSVMRAGLETKFAYEGSVAHLNGMKLKPLTDFQKWRSCYIGNSFHCIMSHQVQSAHRMLNSRPPGRVSSQMQAEARNDFVLNSSHKHHGSRAYSAKGTRVSPAAESNKLVKEEGDSCSSKSSSRIQRARKHKCSGAVNNSDMEGLQHMAPSNFSSKKTKQSKNRGTRALNTEKPQKQDKNADCRIARPRQKNEISPCKHKTQDEPRAVKQAPVSAGGVKIPRPSRSRKKTDCLASASVATVEEIHLEAKNPLPKLSSHSPQTSKPSTEENCSSTKPDAVQLNGINRSSVAPYRWKEDLPAENEAKAHRWKLGPLYPPSGKSVVIVESVTKANLIQNFLGDMFEVLPSYGHVRDLAGRSGSVRPEDDFSIVWEVPSHAWTHLKSMKVALNGAKILILASDPDREGEAISWHIIEMLKQQDALHEDTAVARIVFHEITSASIISALLSPRLINVNLVHAYLARRALDYLIGFNISPLLWRKLPSCQSAGRVQSAALGLICDRETEIEEFKPREFWTTEVEFQTTESGDKSSCLCFVSRLTHFDSKKLEKFSVSSSEEAKSIENKLLSSEYRVAHIKRNQLHGRSYPPYITSSLQLDAANKLHFSTAHTMKVAQNLYEGVKLSENEATGLITYMRTDGFHVSNEAVKEIHSLILERYGEDFISSGTRHFKKVKNAQEAHEAIRPTCIKRLPSQLVGILDDDSLKLYALIWSRTVASQMSPAVFDQLQVDIKNNEGAVLRSASSRLKFSGHQAVYKDKEASALRKFDIEEISNDESAHEEAFNVLQSLKPGIQVQPRKVNIRQHHTEPPPRYSEGALVKSLEELGIGRPSTYVSILKVLQERRYVILKNRVLFPEFRGRMVSAFLFTYFSEVANYGFTADMENELDNISLGKTQWRSLLKDYWSRFSKLCKEASGVDVRQVEKMLEKRFSRILFASLSEKSRTCPHCKQGILNFKISRFGEGYFIGCSHYPKCKYIAKTIYCDNDEPAIAPKDASNAPVFLGLDPGSSDKIYLKEGPYGQYVQLGDDQSGHVPKRVPILLEKDKKSLSLDDALEWLRFPVTLGSHPHDRLPVTLRVSHAGFSVRHRHTAVYLSKKVDPQTMTLEHALKLLSSKKARRIGRPKGSGRTEEDDDVLTNVL